MPFLIHRLRALGRDAVPAGPRRLAVFAGLLCLCTLSGTARAQEPPKGLSKDQVIKLLKEDPAARVQYLVQKYGIAFSLTAEVEQELRQAKATPELLDLVRRLAPSPPQKPPEVKTPLPPPSPAPAPALVINAKPGEAEVYVDDERRGQTSRSGTLRVSGLTPGSHAVRLSLAGHQSFEVNVELTAGETNTVVATLLPVESSPTTPKREPSEAKAAPAPEAKAPSDPNNPLSPHPPGIYYDEQKGATHSLVELEQAPYAGRSASASKARAFGGFGGGGGVKWKSMIFGSKARIRIPAGRPIFYFYFPAPDAATAGYGASDSALRSSSSPNVFVLVHLDSKKNDREIPTKGNVSATVQPKDVIPFDYEKVAAGIYKVQVKDDLGAAEYGFLYGGVLEAMSGAWLYDFGVDGAKKP